VTFWVTTAAAVTGTESSYALCTAPTECYVTCVGDPNRMPPYPGLASPVSKDPGDITSNGVRSSEFGIAGSDRRSLSTMLISIGHHQLCEKSA
jgi:hypothetical protein